MITVAGLFGKLIEAVATKLLSRSIELSTDDKRRAVRSFVEFYLAIEGVENVLARIISVIETNCEREKPIVFSKRIVELLAEVGTMSRNFANALDETVRVIEILDPPLASALQRVWIGKGVFLTELGKLLEKAEFAVEFDGRHPIKELRYSIVDFERFAIALLPEEKEALGALLGIPKDWLSEAVETIPVDRVRPTEFEKLRGLANSLQRHRTSLTKGKEGLRTLIERNFKLEDIFGASRASVGLPR